MDQDMLHPSAQNPVGIKFFFPSLCDAMRCDYEMFLVVDHEVE
jgi:hypothetical protein